MFKTLHQSRMPPLSPYTVRTAIDILYLRFTRDTVPAGILQGYLQGSYSTLGIPAEIYDVAS